MKLLVKIAGHSKSSAAYHLYRDTADGPVSLCGRAWGTEWAVVDVDGNPAVCWLCHWRRKKAEPAPPRARPIPTHQKRVWDAWLQFTGQRHPEDPRV